MKNASAPTLFAPTSPQWEKPLLVLLPGLDGTGKLFAPQISALSCYFDIRCLSIPETNRQNWAALAEAVLSLMQPVRQGRLTYVCGESYGGCLALQVAVTEPSSVDRLILINPASSLRRQTWIRWLTQTTYYLPGWLYTLSGTMALPLLANFRRISPYWQRVFAETVQPISQECVAWRLSMLQRFEIATECLRQLSIPTALLASGSDRLLPSCQEVQQLRQILRWTVAYYLPESGHVCLLEDEVNLVQCLAELEFLPTICPESVRQC